MKVEPTEDSKVPLVIPDVKLSMNSNHRGSLMVFRTINFIVAIGKDGSIDVYSLGGERVRVFRGHSVRVWNMIHLLEDVVLSVDDDGNNISWDASTGEILCTHEVTWDITTISQPKKGTLVFGTTQGMIRFVSHENGFNMKEIRAFKNDQSDSAVANGNIFITQISQKDVYIWHAESGDLLGRLPHEVGTDFATLDDDYIYTYAKTGMCYIHRNAPGYPLFKALDISAIAQNIYPTDIAEIDPINSNLMVVTMKKGGVHFIAYEPAECRASFAPVGNPTLKDDFITSDGRICLVNEIDYCAIFPVPDNLSTDIATYVDAMKAEASPVEPTAVVNGAVKLTGEGSNGEEIDGEGINGERIDGEGINGERISGEASNGEEINGEGITHAQIGSPEVPLSAASMQKEMSDMRAELEAEKEKAGKMEAAMERQNIEMEKMKKNYEKQKIVAEETNAKMEALQADFKKAIAKQAADMDVTRKRTHRGADGGGDTKKRNLNRESSR